MQESMMLLGIEMKRSDELLSRMIPIAISEKIAAGSNAVDTCEVFDMVTIVFNDIPAFLDMCAKCDGLEIVHMLNMMFGLFDIMSEKHCIYKVLFCYYWCSHQCQYMYFQFFRWKLSRIALLA